MADDEGGLPPEGWYDDPSGRPGHQRYWEGEAWAERYRDQGGEHGEGAGKKRRYAALRLVAGVYFVLGAIVATLGGAGVIVAAAQQSDHPTRFDEAGPAAIVIFGLLYVAFIALTLFAAAAFIRLMLSVEDSTRRTALAIEAMQDRERR